MIKIPHGRDGGKGSPQLHLLEVAARVAAYYAETDPTERRICERAFIEWFRYYAERGDPLAKELLADPNWMRRFPVLTFNNFGNIDVNFIRSRLAVPAHLTDARDMFWRVRTNAVGEVGQYLDAAFEKAATWDSDAERDILIDALMTVVKRDDWSAWVVRQNQKLLSNGHHMIGAAARSVRDYWRTDRKVLTHLTDLLDIGLPKRMPAGPLTRPLTLDDMLADEPSTRSNPDLEALLDGPPTRSPLALDELWRQLPDAECYLRNQLHDARAREWERQRKQTDRRAPPWS
jgi:hypothetical protein